MTATDTTTSPTTKSRLLSKRLLPWIVLAALLFLAAIAMLNPPSADRSRPEHGPSLTVETLTLAPTQYQVNVPSYGTVQPRTQIRLVSQVSGEIIWVSPQFRAGGLFSAGDTLLRLDTRDYEADVQIAQAQLLEARRTMAEEQAQSQQALADWNRLGDGGEPSELLLRKPQLLAAEAAVAGAEATLRKAQLSLERSTVTAPFDGRILSTEVDLGEVISVNSALADLYATDYVEIRLPLANADLDYVDLPEPGNDSSEKQPETQQVPVQIHSSLSADTVWPGYLVRTESAIDDNSRQLHVVARVDDPFQLDTDSGAEQSRRKPVKIGEYVTASIRGRTLNDAIVIPNSTVYQGSYVYVVEDGVLQRRDIAIAWQNDTDAVIAHGLLPGDKLVTTLLGQVTSGTRVAVATASDRVGAQPQSADAAPAGRKSRRDDAAPTAAPAMPPTATGGPPS